MVDDGRTRILILSGLHLELRHAYVAPQGLAYGAPRSLCPRSETGDLVVMIHSGSRDIGFYVGGRWMDRAREAWPQGVRHPESKLYALAGPWASECLQAMGVAARHAWANLVVLAEMVRRDGDPFRR